ncbi:hypothetical protein M8C21_024638 [Ambrosia artemisiifolia]|uniref:GPI ethanolamine phosphate transferase 3 n=1 Tax=Ambrosia artemisiifolia TaxID=4212 RepID=A0AAD5CPS6_AMBAR|nr:hypothetical protein M8C21_024638 [Ambrosia artemisiifolia]
MVTWWSGKPWGDRRSAFKVFLFLLTLHCTAILLFTSGFLLTRTELPHYSHCSDVSQSPCNNSPHPNHTCWTKPAVDQKKPWMDKLQVLHKLASESESRSGARIFKAIADPPTTSLQRLKGLTTGGLPTFIDIGNSFGAPAIVEDNLIHQLVQNGKRVVMMGDDTWTQLFPHHFNKSYAYPSFNVKDLDTVDNGCISHLVPTLYDDDWDVLIAHFLGVDHAGHIFGVDSVQMIDKLQQYNAQLEKVVEVLKSQSGKGGLHENTLLLVMGDHGQTVNGDHGGGSPEEVETSIFAMSLKKPSFSVPSEFDTSTCKLDLDGRKVCISSIEQLDFATTVSALLGIPFPFGSIGRVNPMLYALVAGTWDLERYDMSSSHSQLKMNEWMRNYAKVLCVNSWQVKKYIDVYTESSVIGFSADDLKHVQEIYSQAVNWSTDSLHDDISLFNALKTQIDLYSNFLASVAELSRTKFTEFDLRLMGIGFGILLTSIFIHLLVMKRVDDMYMANFPSGEINTISFGLVVSCTIVAARACSFLSNMEEGKMTSFLLASIAMLGLRHSIMTKKMIAEAAALVFLISILRFTIELGLSKQGSPEVSEFHSWVYVADLLPILPLIVLAYLLYKSISSSSCNWLLKFVITGSIFSYILVALHLTLGSSSLSHMTPPIFDGIKGNIIPRAIYVTGIAQLLFLAVLQFFEDDKTSKWEETTLMKAVAMLSVWSSTLIILSGKQGPWIALASVIGGWLISRLGGLDQEYKNGSTGLLASYSSSVTQWSLLASCLFFCTGHWCAFDGLRYATAFTGFDEFTIIPQAILLTIETYGFSHILPTLGLPFLVAYGHSFNKAKQTRESLIHLFQVYLIYGLIMAATTSFTVLCVMIQRRHLMVWGLFAPKFVFDVVGLILTDVLICVSSIIYFV